MNAVAVIEKDSDLKDLAAEINQLHINLQSRIYRSIEDAITIGSMLQSVRERLYSSGKWGTWVDQNISVSRVTVNQYIRFALNPEIARAAPTMNSASLAVRSLPLPTLNRVGRPRKIDPEDARMLYEGGMSKSAIARELGCSANTITRNLHPDGMRKHVEMEVKRARAKRERLKELKDFEDRKLRDAAAKRLGGGVSTAWADIQKLMDVVGSVARNGETQEIRAAFAAAHTDLLRAHQHISQVLHA